MADNDESLGDQQTYEGGAQPADSSDRSLGDQLTFGGGDDSSLSDIGGLTYATGRTMDPADRLEIDRIVARIKKKKYGLRQLIHEIVKSTIFLRK